MELAARYQPNQIEDKWYAYWLENSVFRSQPNSSKEPYTVVIPPPNVTGVLHMGHMLNNTIQDILVRKARMSGKEACWVPGTDHASIATEAKVVTMLKEKGIEKSTLSREEFLSYAWEWKEKYGGIILDQLKKLGASCDWDRTRFTMEPELYDAVQDVFIDLFEKGKIYRGIRMVNWDPQGQTALSDDEVNHKEVQSKLYYIQYPLEGTEGEFVTIATVRPETIMADAAICVNPADERYTHLIGKNAIIPLINKAIPIIADEYVSLDFGTGCLKVTPAHDINDYEIGMRHNLPVIDLLNDNGTLNEKAQIYVGEDRFVARKKIAKELEAKGYLQKTEDYKSNIGFSERTDAVVEPRLSLQWFLSMRDITKPALVNVLNDQIQLHPPKFKNMYRSWMENVKDWCISRQLWWGHRIPAWYCPEGKVAVGKTEDQAFEYYQKKYGKEPVSLTQDEDVLDTWFSSWLWPMSVFDPKVFASGKPNEELKYYYPTNDLVTAPEILYFWVARMAMAGYEYLDEKPFTNVYLTGIVRDKLGRKMSKSLGNSPDPLILIKEFGADAVRTGMLFSSPAGNDLLYDEKLIEQGRNFANKIWNAFRLLSGWEVNMALPADASQQEAVDWFGHRLNAAMEELEKAFADFRIADALMILYKLIWDDYCSWYLEAIKPFEGKMSGEIYEKSRVYFDSLLRLLHPFMPFLTEELWHLLEERKKGESLAQASYPSALAFNSEFVERFEHSKLTVTSVRNLRSQVGMSPKESLVLYFSGKSPCLLGIVGKLANLSEILSVEVAPESASSFRIGQTEYYLQLGDRVNPEEEKEKLNKELAYQQGFLKSVQAKLNNERFVGSAPAQVVEREKAKMADAESKIEAIQLQLNKL